MNRVIMAIHGGHNASVAFALEQNDVLNIYSFESERLDRIKYSPGCKPYLGNKFTSDVKYSWIAQNKSDLSTLINYGLSELGLCPENISNIICINGTEENRLPEWVNRRGYDKIGHHLAHAASAYYTSEGKDALVVVCDGMGDSNEDGWEIQSIWRGRGTELINVHTTRKKHRYDMGIGNAYQLYTYLLGFGFGGCGSTMALSSFGSPIHQRIFHMNDEGDIMLDTDFMDPHHYFSKINYNKRGSSVYNTEYENTIRGIPLPEGYRLRSYTDQNFLDTTYVNMAYDIQSSTERAVIDLIKHFKENGDRHLCLAGGVFLNCRLNSMIREVFDFQTMHVPCAPGDGGLAFGAALYTYFHKLKGNAFYSYTPYMGTKIKDYTGNLPKGVVRRNTADIYQVCAKAISDGKLVAWCQGRSEAGPRALGNRSLLANASLEGTPDLINSRLKKREAFRPFAPIVLEEFFSIYFEGDSNIIPYMLETRDVRSEMRSVVPAIVHVDNSSRVQVVKKQDNYRLYNLLEAYRNLSGIRILVNTSLNRRGEPIIDNAEQAISLLEQGMVDLLVINDTIYDRVPDYT